VVTSDRPRSRSALAEDPHCSGQVGVIGYCIGGGFALRLAGRPGWSASSVNYGPAPDNVEDVLSGACPVVAGFGGRDTGLAGAAEQVRAATDAAGLPADVEQPPRRRARFHQPPQRGLTAHAGLKVAGIGYDHDAAADRWPMRTIPGTPATSTDWPSSEQLDARTAPGPG
jgi:carboxymethylenebutenolidase